MFSIIHPAYAQIKDWDANGANCLSDGVPTLKCLEPVIGNIIFAASGFVIIVLFIMFVMGSYLYLTSLGNPEKLKKARGTLTFAIAGFILFLSSFLILRIIDTLFLGGTGTLLRLNLQ